MLAQPAFAEPKTPAVLPELQAGAITYALQMNEQQQNANAAEMPQDEPIGQPITKSEEPF